MILRPLPPTVAWRLHGPRWAVTPTSGAGAARHGGRFNRPGTLVNDEVELTHSIDLVHDYDAGTWPRRWADFNVDWRSLWFGQRREPPTWVMADEALAAGATGIVFPRRRPRAGPISWFTSTASGRATNCRSSIRSASCRAISHPGADGIGPDGRTPCAC